MIYFCSFSILYSNYIDKIFSADQIMKLNVFHIWFRSGSTDMKFVIITLVTIEADQTEDGMIMSLTDYTP